MTPLHLFTTSSQIKLPSWPGEIIVVGKNSKPDSLKFKTGLSHVILNSMISKYIREGKKMMEQIHKRLANELVRTILERYVRKELDVEQTMDLLGLKRSQLFEWVKRYKENPESFSTESNRIGKRRISEGLESNILKELEIEKALIDNPSMPIRVYNYSYLKDQLWKKYRQEVSAPTIIDRAKKTVFTFPNQRRSIMTGR